MKTWTCWRTLLEEARDLLSCLSRQLKLREITLCIRFWNRKVPLGLLDMDIIIRASFPFCKIICLHRGFCNTILVITPDCLLRGWVAFSHCSLIVDLIMEGFPRCRDRLLLPLQLNRTNLTQFYSNTLSVSIPTVLSSPKLMEQLTLNTQLTTPIKQTCLKTIK